MKILLGLYIVFLFISCKNQATNTLIPEIDKDSIYYPYSPGYTEGYTLGSNKNLKRVADFWKEFENGDVRNSSGDFADYVKYVTPNLYVYAKKDSVLSEIKKLRDNYKTLQTFVHSWMPVKSRNNNEDWVFIWGRQIITHKDNKTQTLELHECWQFDKEGKIMFMKQYNMRK